MALTQIQLGSFFSANGKTVLGGVGGSGLDTQALIKALTDAKSFPAIQAQDQITLNDKQATALDDFATLLSLFQSSADALRNPPGVGNAADNVFKFTSPTVTSNTAVAGGTYLSVTSNPGATLQSYTVSDITSLATAASQTTGSFTLVSPDTTSVVSAFAH
jgi:flagellar capping protein FliD